MDFVNNCSFKNDIPFLNKKSIEDIANNVLKQSRPSCLQDLSPIPIEKILENDFGINICPATLALESKILGQMYFVDFVDEFIEDDGEKLCVVKKPVSRQTVIFDEFMYNVQKERFNFTAAHELGHWVLHQKFFSQGDVRACRSQCTSRSVFIPFPIRNDIDWTEWQANQFASCILMPRDLIREVVYNFLASKNITWRELLCFENSLMRSNFIELSHDISKKFETSKACALIRLEILFNIKYPA